MLAGCEACRLADAAKVGGCHDVLPKLNAGEELQKSIKCNGVRPGVAGYRGSRRARRKRGKSRSAPQVRLALARGPARLFQEGIVICCIFAVVSSLQS
jgi:hypothetical protein